jgi:hypothetical protein
VCHSVDDELWHDKTKLKRFRLTCRVEGPNVNLEI